MKKKPQTCLDEKYRQLTSERNSAWIFLSLCHFHFLKHICFFQKRALKEVTNLKGWYTNYVVKHTKF